MKFLSSVLLALTLCLSSVSAYAQEAPAPATQTLSASQLEELKKALGEPSNWNWGVAVALSAVQLNLKTNDLKRIALAAGYGVVYTGWAVPVGVAAYGGMGVSANEQNAMQGHLLFSVANYGSIGPGVQVFRDADDKMVWQGLVTLALNYNSGVSQATLQRVLQTIFGAK